MGHLCHREITDKLIDTAHRGLISIQLSAEPGWTSTDADAISMAGGGTKTAVVSVPARYIHTPVEMVNMRDVERTIDLIVRLCKDI